VAVQDQTISTNPFENKIFKEEIDRWSGYVNYLKKVLTPNLRMLHFWRRMST
jgi:hypothetical protein